LQVAPANTQPKPAKELAYPTHRQKTMQQKMNITTDEKEHRTANRRLAQWRVKCFYDSLVQSSSFVLLMNICAKNPPLRQAPKR
jgi:hypothetical protein